jgi:hypothetical protein
LEGSSDDPVSPDEPWSNAKSLLDTQPQSAEELDAIRNAVVEREGLLISIFDVLRRVPRRVLMVFKLNDLTRSLDNALMTTHSNVSFHLLFTMFDSHYMEMNRFASSWSPLGTARLRCGEMIARGSLAIYVGMGSSPLTSSGNGCRAGGKIYDDSHCPIVDQQSSGDLKGHTGQWGLQRPTWTWLGPWQSFELG